MITEAIFELISFISQTSISQSLWFIYYIELPLGILMIYTLAYRAIVSERILKTKSRLFSPSSDKVSVIILGNGNIDQIQGLLYSLSKQSHEHIETIMIGHGVSDAVKGSYRNLKQKGWINDLHFLDENISSEACLNYALNFCTGEYVLTLDHHTRSVDAEAIKIMLDHLRADDSLGAIAGQIDFEANTFEKHLYRLANRTADISIYVRSYLGIWAGNPSSLVLYRKVLLHRVGGWDVHTASYGAIGLKLSKIGYHVTFDPRVRSQSKGFIPIRSQSFLRAFDKYIGMLLPKSDFSFKMMIQVVLEIFAQYFFDLLWLIFVIGLIISSSAILPFLIGMIYLFYVLYLAVIWSLYSLIVAKDRESMVTLLYLPIFALSYGVVSRLKRLVSYFVATLYRIVDLIKSNMIVFKTDH